MKISIKKNIFSHLLDKRIQRNLKRQADYNLSRPHSESPLTLLFQDFFTTHMKLNTKEKYEILLMINNT